MKGLQQKLFGKFLLMRKLGGMLLLLFILRFAFFVSPNGIFGRFGKMYFLLERMTLETPSIGWSGRINLCIVTKVQFVLAI